MAVTIAPVRIRKSNPDKKKHSKARPIMSMNSTADTDREMGCDKCHDKKFYYKAVIHRPTRQHQRLCLDCFFKMNLDLPFSHFRGEYEVIS